MDKVLLLLLILILISLITCFAIIVWPNGINSLTGKYLLPSLIIVCIIIIFFLMLLRNQGVKCVKVNKKDNDFNYIM